MPLPPAPSRRAALLAPEAFEITARPRTPSTADAAAAPARSAPASRTRKASGTAAVAATAVRPVAGTRFARRRAFQP